MHRLHPHNRRVFSAVLMMAALALALPVSSFVVQGEQPITVHNGDNTSGTYEYTQRVNQVSNPFSGVSQYMGPSHATTSTEPDSLTWICRFSRIQKSASTISQ
jgi:hypothetical protein